MAQWGDRTISDLIKFMQSTMPPGGTALSGDAYVDLAAFILDANSARSGAQALDANSSACDSQRGIRAACGLLASGRRLRWHSKRARVRLRVVEEAGAAGEAIRRRAESP